MTRVIVAEDSATCLGLLVEIIATDPRLELVATAIHGAEAVRMTKQLRPDVVVMDIHMPVMDGFEATRQIMTDVPTPIVIVSASVDVRQVAVSMQALSLGALALFPKPSLLGDDDFDTMARQFTSSIHAMAGVRVVRRWNPQPAAHPPPPPIAAPPATAAPGPGTTNPLEVVAIAASTGGPGALYQILSELPADFAAPIVVVQHISHGFVEGLAAWLNTASKLRVKVAEPNEQTRPGTVYLAPDDHHLGFRQRGVLDISHAAPIAGFRPSATYMFDSVARLYGRNALGVMLTGMGDDGVAGLRAFHLAGGKVLAQDEDSSVVFGMPGAAVAAGVTDCTLPLDMMSMRIARLVGSAQPRRWKHHD